MEVKKREVIFDKPLNYASTFSICNTTYPCEIKGVNTGLAMLDEMQESLVLQKDFNIIYKIDSTIYKIISDDNKTTITKNNISNTYPVTKSEFAIGMANSMLEHSLYWSGEPNWDVFMDMWKDMPEKFETHMNQYNEEKKYFESECYFVLELIEEKPIYHTQKELEECIEQHKEKLNRK